MGSDLLLFSFLYRSSWLFLGCPLNAKTCTNYSDCYFEKQLFKRWNLLAHFHTTETDSNPNRKPFSSCAHKYLTLLHNILYPAYRNKAFN
jgi:hypothetical protein